MPRITAQQAGDVRLTAFLDVIAWSEGTRQHPLTKNDGYDVIVSGIEGKEIFTDYTDHPFAHREPKIIRLVPRLLSSASGRYQIIRPTWERLRIGLKLPDFSPLSQDLAALELLHELKANVMILAGDVQGAIRAVSREWASFPGSTAGQGGKSDAAEIAAFDAAVHTETV